MNLIICYTPLQVLIAEKIIKQYPQDKFYGVMICSNLNTKFSYYSEKLAQCCDHFYSYHQHTDRFNLLKEIIQLKCKFNRQTFVRVFVASINDIQIQFLLSSITFKQLFTFDDGTANIVDSSVFYVQEPNTLIRRWINIIFNNKYSIEELKNISNGHYTIYPQFKNIIKNIIPIDLFEEKITQIESNDPVNILLGQPVYLDNKKNIELANVVINKFNIDFYLPHPREQYTLSNVSYINTPLIFEDYIIQNFKNKRCNIYTYFSSAILNVKNHNINITGLRINTDNPAYINCYNLFHNIGINIIDIRDLYE